jgi:hypothetical protein
MNRVLANVDIVLDDRQQIGDFAERIRSALQRHDPESRTWTEHNGVFIKFFLQPYMAARADTYEMLQAQLDVWLRQHFPNPLAAAG